MCLRSVGCLRPFCYLMRSGFTAVQNAINIVLAAMHFAATCYEVQTCKRQRGGSLCEGSCDTRPSAAASCHHKQPNIASVTVLRALLPRYQHTLSTELSWTI